MFDGKYLEWNQKRIKAIIENYGVDFLRGKKVLDLGCGHGDIGAAFFRLGADVTSIDARDEHLKIVSKKHHGLKTMKLDLDREWPFANQRFDIILDLGLLCHLQNFEKHLSDVCHSTTHLILETAVCDSEDPNKVFTYPENRGVHDWSFNGNGSRPSAAAIERVLKKCGMDYRRFDSKTINAGTYKYDWSPKNNDEHSNEKRRLWFAERNQSSILGIVRSPSRPQPIVSSQIPIQALPPILPPPRPVHEQVGGTYFNNIRINNVTAPKSNKMKVAVCISGLLRSFEQTFESLFVNLTDQFDCDFFIHTWETMGSHDRHFDYKVSGINVKNIESKIQAIYNPKNLIIEPRKQFHYSELMRQRNQGRDNNGLLSMFYKILECNKLKSAYENQYNFKYDCVIRYRADMLIQSKIIIDPMLNLNSIFIPSFGDFGGINDQFAFSNSKNMDSYSSLFDRMNEYLTDGQVLNPEFLLKYHIDKNKLPIARFNCNYILKRPDGSFLKNDLLERRIGFIR